MNAGAVHGNNEANYLWEIHVADHFQFALFSQNLPFIPLFLFLFMLSLEINKSLVRIYFGRNLMGSLTLSFLPLNRPFFFMKHLEFAWINYNHCDSTYMRTRAKCGCMLVDIFDRSFIWVDHAAKNSSIRQLLDSSGPSFLSNYFWCFSSSLIFMITQTPKTISVGPKRTSRDTFYDAQRMLQCQAWTRHKT